MQNANEDSKTSAQEFINGKTESKLIVRDFRGEHEGFGVQMKITRETSLHT